MARTWPCWAPHSVCPVGASSCRVDSPGLPLSTPPCEHRHGARLPQAPPRTVLLGGSLLRSFKFPSMVSGAATT